jgi:hypothetical protein
MHGIGHPVDGLLAIRPDCSKGVVEVRIVACSLQDIFDSQVITRQGLFDRGNPPLPPEFPANA